MYLNLKFKDLGVDDELMQKLKAKGSFEGDYYKIYVRDSEDLKCFNVIIEHYLEKLQKVI